MIVTTTDSVNGRTITEYLGIVSSEAVMGTNLFQDIFAGVRDVVGGRSAAYESELRRAKELAIEDLIQAAREMDADAVVGVDLDYEAIGGGGKSMLMVSCNGTAVKLG